MHNALNISEKDRMLIVAPHPDDETIGCGGILALCGAQCDVALLTDGRKGKPANGSKTEEETAEIRKAEFEEVMASFGVNNYMELGINDSQLESNAKAVYVLNLKDYDYIFVPNRNERHPDHKAAHKIMKKLHRRQKSKACFIEYEVWSPIISANRFLDISALMDKKIENLQKYKSQIKELDYNALARGLNAYRGAPHHVEYCEAYYCEAESKKLKKQIFFAKLPKCLKRLFGFVKNSFKQ